ncbi:MAG: WD40 repeat domain-containing protein [Gemmataceae bacterium]|nr:WD40 repeat domain-containing protein [Gemmataceae bacterium]
MAVDVRDNLRDSRVQMWDVSRDRDPIERIESRASQPAVAPHFFRPPGVEVAPPPRPVGPDVPRVTRMSSDDGRLSVEWAENTADAYRLTFGRGDLTPPLPPTGSVVVRDAGGNAIGRVEVLPGYGGMTPKFLADDRRLLLVYSATEQAAKGFRVQYRWFLYALDDKLRVVANGSSSSGPISQGFSLITSAPDGKSVVLRDARTGGVISRLDSDETYTSVSRFDPTGRTFLLAHKTKTVATNATAPLRVANIDAATGKELWGRELGEGQWVQSATFDPSGKRVAVRYWTPTEFRLWIATSEGTRLLDIVVHAPPKPTGDKGGVSPSDAIGANTGVPMFSPDGRHAAVETGADLSAGFEVWNLDTGSRVLQIPSNLRTTVTSPVFSADGTRLFTRDAAMFFKGPPAPTRLRVWDLTTGRELLALPVAESDNGLEAGYGAPTEVPAGFLFRVPSSLICAYSA